MQERALNVTASYENILQRCHNHITTSSRMLQLEINLMDGTVKKRNASEGQEENIGTNVM